MSEHNPHEPEKPDRQGVDFILDQKPHSWSKDEISGAELRHVGNIPADFELWQEVPGHEDIKLKDADVVNLRANPRVEKFFSVKPDATAGE